MFCKGCGKPIDSAMRECPHCGRPVDALSGGTGFWDLIVDMSASQKKDDSAVDPTPQQVADSAVEAGGRVGEADDAGAARPRQHARQDCAPSGAQATAQYVVAEPIERHGKHGAGRGSGRGGSRLGYVLICIGIACCVVAVASVLYLTTHGGSGGDAGTAATSETEAIAPEKEPTADSEDATASAGRADKSPSASGNEDPGGSQDKQRDAGDLEGPAQ